MVVNELIAVSLMGMAVSTLDSKEPKILGQVSQTQADKL